MPTVLPAMQVKFGQTEYFVSYMPVNEILQNVQFPQNLEGWKDMTIDDKFQREINLSRVKKEIARYFATDNSRFSGALLLAIQNSDSIKFDPLTKFPDSIPSVYLSSAEHMGFLILNGKEKFIPLDGQHRIKAFKFAINGTDDDGKPVPGFKANTDVGADQIAVILIRFESKNARKIFNKINKYARPTSKHDNLITDDDDTAAVVTRRLIGDDGILPVRLVKTGKSSLTGSDVEFSTLNTLYESNRALFNILCASGSTDPRKLPPNEVDIYLKELRKEWDYLFTNVNHWKSALKDITEKGDDQRKAIREEILLGKPIGQLSLIKGYVERLESSKTNKDLVVHAINSIDWSVKSKMWTEILVLPSGRMMTKKVTTDNAAKFISYMLGKKFNNKEKQDLETRLYGEDSNRTLPDPVGHVDDTT